MRFVVEVHLNVEGLCDHARLDQMKEQALELLEMLCVEFFLAYP